MSLFFVCHWIGSTAVRKKVAWVLQGVKVHETVVNNTTLPEDSKVKYGGFHRLTQKIDNNHYLIYYQLGKRYFPVDICICAKCNWRVCIAYNKYSAAASMIIYSVQYKGSHIPLLLRAKNRGFMASYFSCLRHIGFWTANINTPLPSSVSDILAFEQEKYQHSPPLNCFRHIGFWTGNINTRLPSYVSAILDFEQEISTLASPHLFPTYWI